MMCKFAWDVFSFIVFSNVTSCCGTYFLRYHCCVSSAPQKSVPYLKQMEHHINVYQEPNLMSNIFLGQHLTHYTFFRQPNLMHHTRLIFCHGFYLVKRVKVMAKLSSHRSTNQNNAKISYLAQFISAGFICRSIVFDWT